MSARNSERLAWNIQSALVDGFVLLCIENGEKLVELTRERAAAVRRALALGKPDDTISAIGVDDYAGAQMAARHLAQLGHRRFGILGLELDDEQRGPVGGAAIAAAIYSTSRDRAYGYFEELALYGIDRETIPIYETRSTAESVRRGLDYPSRPVSAHRHPRDVGPRRHVRARDPRRTRPQRPRGHLDRRLRRRARGGDGFPAAHHRGAADRRRSAAARSRPSSNTMAGCIAKACRSSCWCERVPPPRAIVT